MSTDNEMNQNCIPIQFENLGNTTHKFFLHALFISLFVFFASKNIVMTFGLCF